MKSIPAMPPVDASDAALERSLVAQGEEAEWVFPAEIAFCHAQALAGRDGVKRRVFKGDDGWRIEPAVRA